MKTTLIPAEPTPSSCAAWGTTPWRWVLISLYWLPLSLFWGAMLGQVLPTRVQAFAGAAHSGTYLALISISGAIVGLLIQIVIGPISDAWAGRWGRRRPFIFWGTLLSLGALLGFAHAQSFLGLVIAFAAIQLFLNTANGPYQALIPDLVPLNRQGSASGVLGFMSLLGDAAGPVLGGVLLTHAATPLRQAQAIQEIVWVVSALLLICMLVTVFAVPDPAVIPDTENPPPLRHTLLRAIRSSYVFEMRQHPSFYWLLVSRAIYNLGFYTVLDFLAYYVEFSLHQGPGYHKPLMVIQVVAIGGALAGTVPAAWLSDRISKKRIIAFSTVFSVVAGIAFALTPTLGFALTMAALFGVGYGIFRAVDWAFACNLLPPGGAAKFMAIWGLSTMVPQLFAPGIGPICDHLNHLYGMGFGYRAAMLTIPLYAVLGLACLRPVREKAI